MWIKKLVVVAFIATLTFAQEEVESGPSPADEEVEAGPSPDADAQGESVGVRKLRLRRPRPKILGIENEDGIAQGRPVPLTAGVPVDQLINRQKSTADLLAAAVQEPNSALQNLLETASEGSGFEEEQQPILPLRQQPVDTPRRQQAPRRRVPGVPRRAQGSRSRPRPVQNDDEAGNGRPRPDPVKTTERYSHMNPDGSFTFGYVSEDGSFREETRGLDCITRGKYGYIDPEGKRREFTYVSGLPCDEDQEQQFDQQGFAIEDDENAIQQDPIDPADRFRQSQAVQLADDEIPDSARRQPQRRPAQRRPQPSNQFSNFGSEQQPARQQRPRVRPTAAAPRPTQGGSALQNLFSIADGSPAPQPSPTPVVTRPRPTPTRARPTANARPNFDFDSEVDSFTLNRPALTFQGNQEQPRSQSGTPAPANQAVGPNFSSELVFDPASGTFKTELRQAIPGQPDITIQDSAQPGARRPQPTQPTAAAPRPTPTAAFASTSRRPTPTGNPTAFSPLSFPDPASVQRPASPSPSPVPSPTPRPTTPVRPPTPTRPAPVPVTTPRPPTTPARPAGPTNPANSFFFQPFPTVGSPRPVAPGQPATTIRPPTIIPAGTFNLNAGRPVPAQPRPTAAQVPQPPQIPGFPRPTPVVQAQPTSAARPTVGQPQLQFGFSPIPQTNSRPVATVQGVPRPQVPQGARPVQAPQGARPVPFTAFRNGLPQQLQGQPRPQFQGRPQGAPQGAFTAFAPRPQQPQARPPQGFAVRPPPQAFQQRPEQFRTAGAPPARFQGRPAAPPAGFSVFNPASLRGARF